MVGLQNARDRAQDAAEVTVMMQLEFVSFINMVRMSWF